MNYAKWRLSTFVKRDNEFAKSCENKFPINICQQSHAASLQIIQPSKVPTIADTLLIANNANPVCLTFKNNVFQRF